MFQCPMASELPVTPDAEDLVDVAVVVVDVQAARGEAPNNQLPVIPIFIFLLTPCIGIGAIRIEPGP